MGFAVDSCLLDLPGLVPNRRALEAHFAALEAKGIDVSTRAREIALAFACCHGDAVAVARFHEEVVPRMRRALARVRISDVSKEEIIQVSVVRMMVGGSEARPRLLDYEGRAPLASWACTVVTRAGLDEARRPLREETFPEASSACHGIVIAAPPELGHLVEAWRVAFKIALEQAMTALSIEDRALLRMHFVEGKTLDLIARAFAAHPTTVSRRLANLRRELAARTREGVTKRLGLTESDIESVERACVTGIDLSMSRLLTDDDPLALLESRSES